MSSKTLRQIMASFVRRMGLRPQRRLLSIAEESRRLPPLDDRTPDAILYDYNGLPKARERMD